MFSSNSTTTCLIGVAVRTGLSAAVSEAPWCCSPLAQLGTVASVSAPAAATEPTINADRRPFHFPGPIVFPPEGYAAPVLGRSPGQPGSHRAGSTITLTYGDEDVNSSPWLLQNSLTDLYR